MLMAGVSAMILPGAGRKWIKRSNSDVLTINPAWINAEYEIHFWVSSVPVWDGRRYDLIPVVFNRETGPPKTPPAGYRLWENRPWPPLRIPRSTTPLHGAEPIYKIRK